MRWKPPPHLVHALGSRLAASLRYRALGLDHVRNGMRHSPTRSVIFCLWHQSMVVVLGTHHHQKIAALTSLSADGTVMAEYLARIGLRSVRGSSSRGGLKAARELMTAIQEGWHAAITVDGPRGPFKEVKPGPFEIARRTGAPIIPVGARASGELCFKRAWDRFRLPVPRARVAIVYGEPIWAPPEYPTPEELFAKRISLGHQLHHLEAKAGSLVERDHQGPPLACMRWMKQAPAIRFSGDP